MRFPVTLTINIVLKSFKLLGYFPTTAGGLTTISSIEIITGETLNYKRHLAIPFGKYSQIHEEDIPRNSTRPRTRGAMCMGTSINNQVGLRFMTLGSMKNVVSKMQDAISLPDTMIAQVKALGQGQPNDIDLLDSKKRIIGEI